MSADVIEKYMEKIPIYKSFTNKLHSLITELLENEGVKFHLIESRVKAANSFSEKINRPSKFYPDPLNDITDISGLRVIVYYSDDILKVAKIIEREFEKIECEDVHQPGNYNANSFGYLSLHYIVKINNIRKELGEWKRFNDFKSEIQIRTVLQHSWAAISHALQYKSEFDAPKSLRRKLFRLAGLFELADEEFMSVRDLAKNDKSEVRISFASGDKDIVVSAISLDEFMNSWKDFKDILNYMKGLSFILETDDAYVALEDYSTPDEEKSSNYYGIIAALCEKIGIKTISQLEDSLDINFDNYLTQLDTYQPGWVMSNSFILYLLFVRANIENISSKLLIDNGWYDKLAIETIRIAKEDKKSTNHINP